MKIICIEDSDLVRKLIVSVVQRMGHEILSFTDGQKADAMLDENWKSIDLVITDHNLPNLTGLLIAQNLRARGYNHKIIVYCSQLPKETEASYRACGVTAIFKKPISLEQLRGAIDGRS